MTLLGRSHRPGGGTDNDGTEAQGTGEATGESNRPRATATAEWHELESVRVHEPGFETFAGTLDAEANLFLEQFALFEARAEHERLADELERHGVDVHHLHEDLDRTGAMDQLLSSRVSFDLSEVAEEVRSEKRDQLRSKLRDSSAYDKLQAVAINATVVRHRPEDGTVEGPNPGRYYAGGLRVERPLSNLYFQRDQQFVTERGVVVCSMNKNTRRPEVEVVRATWNGLGADLPGEAEGGDLEKDPDTGIVVADMSTVDEHEVSDRIAEHAGVQSKEVHVEGGDFVPAGDFALLGVSAKISAGEEYPEYGIAAEDTEYPFRTTYTAGHKLLTEDVFGTEEVALVRAPFEAAQNSGEYAEEIDMATMHLDTWFNLVDEDLAVAHGPLLETEVDVYRAVQEGNGRRTYELTNLEAGERSGDQLKFGEYIRDERGFEVVDVVEHIDEDDPAAVKALKAVTNFLTLGPRTVLPIRIAGEDGEEFEGVLADFVGTLREDHDVEIVPDGEGLAMENLRSGYGGVRCLTTPIRRRE